MSAIYNWSVYYLQATNEIIHNIDGTTTEVPRPAGYVWNRIVWDGVSEWKPPYGSAVVLDDEDKYPIGSIYTPTSSTRTAG